MNKKPLSSKKFWSFFLTLLVLAAISIIALFTQPVGWALASVLTINTIATGCLSIGYILNQKSLDKFLSSVSVVTGNSKEKKDADEDC